MANCGASPQAVTVELGDFTELTDFTDLDKLMEKVPASRPTPIYILSIKSMVHSIFIGQLGLAA